MWFFFKIIFLFQFSLTNQTKGLRFFSHDYATAALAVLTQWMDIPSVRQLVRWPNDLVLMGWDHLAIVCGILFLSSYLSLSEMWVSI